MTDRNLKKDKSRAYHKAIAVMLLCTAFVSAGCSSKNEQKSSAGKLPEVVKGIKTEKVTLSYAPESIELSGTVRAKTIAMVSARVPGTISMLKVREGDRVKKGEIVARIEAQENQANALAASAGIDEAHRAFDESMSRKRLADTTFERYHKLFNQQVVSRQEFDIKKSELEIATQDVARAEARLRQAQQSAKAAGAMADYTKITAPISGIVTSKPADLGATVFPSQPIMTVEDEGSYQLELAIPENLASKVKSGTPVKVSIDATGESFDAKVAEIVPAADPQTRTYTAKINLNRRNIRTGMFGRGQIVSGSADSKGLLVSEKSIVERGAITSVLVIDKDKTAKMRIVKTGRKIGNRIEIISGLSEHETIVSEGAERITDGSKVE